MKNAYVAYRWYDDFNHRYTAVEVEWFETIEDAEKHANDLKDRNGGYVRIEKVGTGNGERYAEIEDEIARLNIEIAILKKEREGIIGVD